MLKARANDTSLYSLQSVVLSTKFITVWNCVALDTIPMSLVVTFTFPKPSPPCIQSIRLRQSRAAGSTAWSNVTTPDPTARE